MVRKPAVSGQFYPGDSKTLGVMIDGLIPKETAQVSAKAVILPHAGYVYSGKVAVVTLSRVLPRKRLIMLGPNHTGIGPRFSLWSKGEWEIPFGKVKIDEDLAEKILNAGSSIEADEMAHQDEYSLEVQLPIFYRLFGEFSFVPIACQAADLKTY
ncbi:MAG: AmmeMemoRadiSam system protein B, partial [Candidatus Omnitrophica bacterium]|nr:AmmeMemoRadiSam system protein B [Candidatus Omnitrophota bacterium]